MILTYKEMSNNYWKYYLMLESKFIDSTRYVELDSDNYTTYSIDFANQIITIGSELDVFFKVASDLNLSDKKTIKDYYNKISNKYSDIKNQKVTILNKKDMVLQPFKKWNENFPGELDCWKSYNNIKHNRVLKFKESKLENALNILAALFILEMYYFKTIFENNESEIDEKYDVPEIGSNLFKLENFDTYYDTSNIGPIAGDELSKIQIDDIINSLN